MSRPSFILESFFFPGAPVHHQFSLDSSRSITVHYNEPVAERTTMARPWLLSLLILISVSISGTASTFFHRPTTATLPASISNATITANTTTTSIPRWKQQLPGPLQQRSTLQRILIPTSPGHYTQVYLLGTSHVSNDSSADVQLLLNHILPDVVFLEVCEQRADMLAPPMEFDTNTTFWEKVAVVSKNGMTRASAVGTVLLTTVQQDYAKSLGVELGSEFRVAYEYCLKSHPTILILGDRPLRITLVRAWESLSWWGKVRVLAGLAWNSIRRTDPNELREWMQKILMEGETDVLTESIAELRKHFPTLERVILQERDAYMACKLYQTCRMLPRQYNHSIVAIVGAGHVTGICQWLTNTTTNKSPEEILEGLVQTKKWGDAPSVRPLVTDVTQLSMRHV